MSSSTEILRKMVLGNDKATRLCFQMSGGGDIGIQNILSNPAKLTAILRNVLRLTINEIESVVGAESTPGHVTPAATWEQIESLKLAGYIADKGKY